MTDENTTPNNENDQEVINLNVGTIVETPQDLLKHLYFLKSNFELLEEFFGIGKNSLKAVEELDNLINSTQRDIAILDTASQLKGEGATHLTETISEHLYNMKTKLPTLEQMDSEAIEFFSYSYGEQLVQEITGFNDDEIVDRSTDADNNIIDGSLIDLIEKFGKTFTVLMREQLAKSSDFETKYFINLYEKYAYTDEKDKIIIIDNSPLSDIINSISKKCKSFFNTSTIKRALLIDVERVKHYPIKTLKTPVDLTTKTFFGINPPMPKKNGNGQWEFIPLKIGSEKKPVNLFYTYNVNLELLQQLGISNKFTSKDLIICSIIEGFRESGNKYITLTQLHKALGNTSSPNSNQLKELEERLTKLLSTTLNMDTREIAEAYNLENYDEYIGSLLPIALVKQKKIINGQLVEGFIEIQGAAPLIALAKNINQVTAVNPKLLQVKITHNEMFYVIFNYLLTEIAHIKNPNYSRVNKIVYKTLFKEAEITKRQEPRALTIMTAILDHFIDLNFITGWKEETKNGEPGVKFTWNNTEEIEDKANKK